MSSQKGVMMKIKKVTKLWKGYFVSVRCYEIDGGIKKGGLKILHNDDSMVLSVDDLKHLKATEGQVVKGPVSGKDYKLYDIIWKPLTHDPRQENLI